MLPESALYISCHSLTCGRKGKSSFMSANNRHHAFVTALALSVEYNEEKKKKKPRKRKTNTFRSIMLRQFPLSLVGLFYLMFPHPVLEKDGYFWTLTSVSPVCLKDKVVFIHTCFLSASPSAQPAGQYKINHIFIV